MSFGRGSTVWKQERAVCPLAPSPARDWGMLLPAQCRGRPPRSLPWAAPSGIGREAAGSDPCILPGLSHTKSERVFRPLSVHPQGAGHFPDVSPPPTRRPSLKRSSPVHRRGGGAWAGKATCIPCCLLYFVSFLCPLSLLSVLQTVPTEGWTQSPHLCTLVTLA